MGDNTSGGKGITRRGFLTGGTALLAGAFLPKVPGAEASFIVPIYPETQVMVVGRTQVGIAVVDCAEDPLLPVEGAQVELYSSYNKKTISGKADAQGRLTLDIETLAEAESADSPAPSGSKKEEYCFNGRMHIKCKGYREVILGRMRFRSVSALIAPTRKLVEGEPYIRKLAFDDWDIQYSKATFLADESNAGMHTLTADVWLPAGMACEVRFYYRLKDEETGKVDVADIGSKTLKTADGAAGFSSATFEEAFLDDSISNHALPVGCEVHVVLTFNGVVHDQICGLSVQEPPVAECEDGEVSLAPCTFYDDSLSVFTLPKSLPKPLGGSSFSIWKPVFDNIGFDFSPAGYLMIGFTIGSMSALNENGSAIDRDAWKEWPEETAKDQYKRVTGKMKTKLSKVKEMRSSMKDSGKAFAHSYSSLITATGSFQIFANLDYDWSTKYWGGSLSAVVGGVVDGTWTIQALIGPVPAFISFDASAELDAGLTFAMKTYGSSISALFKNFTYDADSSTVAITTNIEIGLALGVGVAGVASVYIRGAGWVTLNIAFYQGAPEAKSPRLTVGLGLSASVGIQVLLFKWSGPIWSHEWPTYIDTASDKASPLSLQSANATMTDLSAIADQMTIVTNEELMGVKEFQVSSSGVKALSKRLAAEIESRELGSDCIEWTMPKIAETGGSVLMSAKKAAKTIKYLGKSATSASPAKNIGVAGTGEGVLGGVKPTADTVIFKNVFSDAKMKVVHFGSRDVMFRIASVGYGSEARTRLTYSIIGSGAWSNPIVVDFSPSGADVSRTALYDYDFDATVVGSWERYIYVMLISGTRPEGDGTSFADANAKTIISLIRIYDANFPTAPLAVSSAISWEASSFVKDSACYSFSLPQLTAYTDTASYDNETNSCLIGACLMRRSTTASGLVGKNAISGLLGFFAEHRRNQTPKITTCRTSVSVKNVNRIVAGPIAFDEPLQSSIRAEKRHANIGITANPSNNNICSGVYGMDVVYDDDSKAYTASFSVRVNPRGYFDVARLYPSGSDGDFYAIRVPDEKIPTSTEEFQRDGRLYLASFNPSDSGEFEFTPVGPEDFSPTELAVSGDGRYLYYAVNKEGKSGQESKKDGTLGTPTEDDVYRIMAMARVEGLFTKPFVLCELDHPVDRVVSMTSMGAAATLITADITDAAKSRANIHDIRIPLAVCATPLSIASVGSFVYAGEDNEFNVEVRNDGNTIISSFTAELLDGAGNVVDKTDVELGSAVQSIDADDGQGSIYELEALPQELAASPLAIAASGSLLAPGKTICYCITFKIPASWSNDRTVRVRILNTSVHIVQPQSALAAFSAQSRKAKAKAKVKAQGKKRSGKSLLQTVADSSSTWEEFVEEWEADLYENPYRSYKIKKKSLPSFDITVLKSQGFDDSNLVRADYIEHATNSNPFAAK